MSGLESQIQNASSARVTEAALMVLPKLLEIQDPIEAITRIRDLAQLSDQEAAEAEAFAKEASENSADEIVSLLRLVLIDMAQTDEGEIGIKRALEATGHKQVVIGPDLLFLAALGVAGYIAYLAQGRSKAKKTITIEEDKKSGRKKVTIGEETHYLNPFNPLAGLFARITKSS